MTILVDASAIVAMLTQEPEAEEMGMAIRRHPERLCCALGLWEATLAIARKSVVSTAIAQRAVDRLREDFGIGVVPIGEREAVLALETHNRYGKGTGHPARLNMGDCFAYACARANDAKLLYKGNDFAKTDLA